MCCFGARLSFPLIVLNAQLTQRTAPQRDSTNSFRYKANTQQLHWGLFAPHTRVLFSRLLSSLPLSPVLLCAARAHFDRQTYHMYLSTALLDASAEATAHAPAAFIPAPSMYRRVRQVLSLSASASAAAPSGPMQLPWVK